MKRWGRIVVSVVVASVTVCVALAATGTVGFGSLGKSLGLGREPRLALETSRVDRGPVVARITATGMLSALVTVQVGSQISGRIQDLYADYGSIVKRGQVIARLDTRLLQAALEQARANMDAAEGTLAKARAEAVGSDQRAARVRQLRERELVAQAEADSAEAAAAATRAGVTAAQGEAAQARAALHQARLNLDYAIVRSPIPGVVISRNVDVGQTVAASLQAPTLFTIAEDLRKMQVDTAVSEADVGKVRPGMPATFTVDAYPGELFTGTVRQVRDAPQNVQSVVTYDAVIDVANPELKLKPGMTANVSLVWADRKDVLRVPTAALRFRPPAELLGQAAGLASAGGGRHKHKDKDKAKDKDRNKGKPAGDVAAAGGAGAGATEAPAARRRDTVWVLESPDRRLREVPIALGVSDGTRVEVQDGELHEGDVVLTDAVDDGHRPRDSASAGKPKKKLF